MNRWIVAAELGVWLGRLITSLLCCVSVAVADPPRTLMPCKVLDVHDGDSFRVSFDVPFIDGLRVENRMVRVQGADAWEVHGGRPGVTVSDAEKRKGKAARDAVAELLKRADGVYLEPRRPGDIAEPHGRISAHVWVYERDPERLYELADWLVENNHVRQ